MFCSRCGTANPDGSDVKYCRSCGAELQAQDGAPASAAALPTEVYVAQPQAAFAPGASYAAQPQVTYAAGPVGVPVQAAVFPYGGFWIRFVAYLIDFVIVAITGGIIGFAWGTVGNSARLNSSTTTQVGQALGVLLGLSYYVALPPLAGATLGKLILGYNIVGSDGRRIGFGRALGRYLSYIVSALVLCLGFIWIGIDSYKQGWHDKIAGTYVVRKEFVKP